jgi:hypothetical protein
VFFQVNAIDIADLETPVQAVPELGQCLLVGTGGLGHGLDVIDGTEILGINRKRRMNRNPKNPTSARTKRKLSRVMPF